MENMNKNETDQMPKDIADKVKANRESVSSRDMGIREDRSSEKIEAETPEHLATPLTPSTDDPAAVLAPDDTFPGSGPLHPDR